MVDGAEPHGLDGVGRGRHGSRHRDGRRRQGADAAQHLQPVQPRHRPGRLDRWPPGCWRHRLRAGRSSGQCRSRSGRRRRATPPSEGRPANRRRPAAAPGRASPWRRTHTAHGSGRRPAPPPPRPACAAVDWPEICTSSASAATHAASENAQSASRRIRSERNQRVMTPTAPGRACGPALRRGAGPPAGRWRRIGRSPP